MFDKGHTLLEMLIKLDEIVEWNHAEEESAAMEVYLNTTLLWANESPDTKLRTTTPTTLEPNDPGSENGTRDREHNYVQDSLTPRGREGLDDKTHGTGSGLS
jgi:hypothetical protein